MSMYRHDPREEPADCLFAVLHELASSDEDRGRLLEHGLAALAELERRWVEARTLARRYYQAHLTELPHAPNAHPPDAALPTWLTEGGGP